MKTEITDHERDELADLAVQLDAAEREYAAADGDLSEYHRRIRAAKDRHNEVTQRFASLLRSVTETGTDESTPALVLGRFAFYAIGHPSYEGSQVVRLPIVL